MSHLIQTLFVWTCVGYTIASVVYDMAAFFIKKKRSRLDWQLIYLIRRRDFWLDEHRKWSEKAINAETGERRFLKKMMCRFENPFSRALSELEIVMREEGFLKGKPKKISKRRIK